MKRLIILSLIFVMAFQLCACSDVSTSNSNLDSSIPATIDKSETVQNNTNSATSPNSTGATNAPTTVPDTAPTTSPATEPAHTHSFKPATCTAPKTCSCGATEGTPADHSWTAATCTAPQKCKTCSAEKGSAKGHSYSQGACTTCGSSDPDYVSITYVLNTHTMKFHKPSCGKLPTDNRKDTTMSRDEVTSAGYVACKICNP